MLAKNLPIELIDKIVQFDGRIKYRKGEFVIVIDPSVLKEYESLLDPLLKKKTRISNSVKFKTHRDYFLPYVDDQFVIRNEKIEEAFYFEFDFDNMHGVGLSYDYHWFSNDFKISYFDDRNYMWNNHVQAETIIN